MIIKWVCNLDNYKVSYPIFPMLRGVIPRVGEYVKIQGKILLNARNQRIPGVLEVVNVVYASSDIVEVHLDYIKIDKNSYPTDVLY